MSLLTAPRVTRTVTDRTVSTDSGAITITDAGNLPVASTLGPGGPLWTTTPDSVSVRTGYGAGTYELATIHDTAGHVVGLDVVFLHPDFETAVAVAPTIAGETELDHLERLTRMFHHLIEHSDPADTSTAHTVGMLHLASGIVTIHDTRHPGLRTQLGVEPGLWGAVTYTATIGPWGSRVVRFALHRTDRPLDD